MNFVLLIGIFAVGCQRTKNDQNSSTIKMPVSDKLENTNFSNMEVKTSVTPETYLLSETEITINYRFTNHSPLSFQFRSAVKIEKQRGRLCVEEPFLETVGFEDILYSIGPKESKDFQIPLFKLLKYKNLSLGTYRIGKKVCFTDQKKN